MLFNLKYDGFDKENIKMSKSDPNSAIFMEDTESEIKKKINGAYCLPGKIEGNPCLDYLKHIVFNSRNYFEIKRKPEFGGDK